MKIAYIILGVIFLLIGVAGIIADYHVITQIIIIDKDGKFTGSLAAFMFPFGALFIWLAFRESKSDVLKKIEEEYKMSQRLFLDNNKRMTIRFRLGPTELHPDLIRSYESRNLKGSYNVIVAGAQRVTNADLDIYKSEESDQYQLVIAKVPDVPLEENTLVELNLTDGVSEWTGSVSSRVRSIDLKLKGA